MSNRPNTRRRRSRPQERTGVDRKAIIIGGSAVVAVVVAIGLAFSLGGSDDAGALEVSPRVVVEGAAPLPQFADGTVDPAVGSAAPTLIGLGIDGEPLSIVPGGDPLLLVFAAHWCPHCQAEIPRIAGPLAERVDDLEVRLISTSVDQRADNYPPSAWLADEEWPSAVLMDDADRSAATAYGLSSFPFFVFVDDTGAVVLRLDGEQDTATLLELVDGLVEAQLG